MCQGQGCKQVGSSSAVQVKHQSWTGAAGCLGEVFTFSATAVCSSPHNRHKQHKRSQLQPKRAKPGESLSLVQSRPPKLIPSVSHSHHFCKALLFKLLSTASPVRCGYTTATPNQSTQEQGHGNRAAGRSLYRLTNRTTAARYNTTRTQEEPERLQVQSAHVLHVAGRMARRALRMRGPAHDPADQPVRDVPGERPEQPAERARLHVQPAVAQQHPATTSRCVTAGAGLVPGQHHLGTVE